ncbi:MAG TPA: UDP-N-acetyl glucosamine 2-epimerase [Candidatus Desulfovibrio gallistercoris]|nr:UDP-N-acetyl glucosamine 2-epimerase [Candidatus Desulfovibrio gallistercoris]
MHVALFAASRPHYRMAAAVARLAEAHGAWRSLILDALPPAVRASLPAQDALRTLRPAATEAELRALLRTERPDALLVFGGGETALAAGRAALEEDVPLLHLEAGQRPAGEALRASHEFLDREALLRCCLGASQARTLEAEGIAEGVCVTGDALYDLFQEACSGLDPAAAAARLQLTGSAFALVSLDGLWRTASSEERHAALAQLAQWGSLTDMDILLLSDLPALPAPMPGVRLLPALPPRETLSLLCACRCLLTDSDSLQREAFYAGKRALVPAAAHPGQLALPLESGWHRHAPLHDPAVLAGLTDSLTAPCPHPGLPEGSGRAVRRMVAAVVATLADRADGLL